MVTKPMYRCDFPYLWNNIKKSYITFVKKCFQNTLAINACKLAGLFVLLQ